MGGLLTAADLIRLEAATRALLSPLAFDDTDGFSREVMRTFRDVLGARDATFYLPGQPVVVLGDNGHYAERLDAYTRETWGGTGTSCEPILDEFHTALVQQGVAVWNMASADHDLLGNQGRAWDNTFYHEVLAGVGAGDTHGLFFPTAQGSAMLTAFDFRRAPVDDEHFPLLRVLHPALVAGVQAFNRFMTRCAALDAVAEPLAVFDTVGREVHRNPALAALLAADPEADRVEVALTAFALDVRPLGFPRCGEAPTAPLVKREVSTGRMRYALRVALLPSDGLGYGEVFLVSVATERAAPAFPSVEEARERHGLTEREAEVIVLVARGLSNAAIAERLFVSRHTVRHHVESAMAKLGLTGRGREAVAAHLLGAGCLTAA